MFTVAAIALFDLIHVLTYNCMHMAMVKKTLVHKFYYHFDLCKLQILLMAKSLFYRVCYTSTSRSVGRVAYRSHSYSVSYSCGWFGIDRCRRYEHAWCYSTNILLSDLNHGVLWFIYSSSMAEVYEPQNLLTSVSGIGAE